MAIPDPKNYAVAKKDDQPTAAEPSMAQVLAMMAGVLQELKGAKTSVQADAALRQVELMERLLNKTKPENTDHPGISVYSYPEGDLKKPRTVLRCPTFWCGGEISGTTETPEEIELLNRLEAGETRVTKSDGSTIPFRVEVRRADNGKLERVNVWFPCTKEHKHNHMPMTSYLRQSLGESLPSREEMAAQLAAMKEELARAKAGVMSAV